MDALGIEKILKRCPPRYKLEALELAEPKTDSLQSSLALASIRSDFIQEHIEDQDAVANSVMVAGAKGDSFAPCGSRSDKKISALAPTRFWPLVPSTDRIVLCLCGLHYKSAYPSPDASRIFFLSFCLL
jgi:hypothetical protein